MDALQSGEPLLTLVTGAWRLLVPLRSVARVVGAALPVVAPGSDGSARAALELPGELVPLVFAQALLGAARVSLATTAKIVLLHTELGSAALWVDSVDDVVNYEPWVGDLQLGGELSSCIAAFSAGPPAAPVLDASALVRSVRAAA